MFVRQRINQFLRFCTVGLANTAVDFSVFIILTLGGVPYLLAQVISYSAGTANSFFLNRKWTFQVAGKTNIMEVVRFVVVNGLSLLMSSGMLFVLHHLYEGDLWLSKAAATAASVALNYIGSRTWVFVENQRVAGNGGIL